MNPKKLKSFYPILAQQLNVPVEVVEVMYDTLFEYLANKIRNLEGKEIYLKNIGTFSARRSKIEKLQKRLHTTLDRIAALAESGATTPEQFIKDTEQVKVDLERLEKIKEDIHKDWLEKQEKKKLRYEYISRSLEEQETDNGGDSE